MSEPKKKEQPGKELRIEKQVELDASVSEVWKALTDPAALVNWFPLEARVAPGVGGQIFLSWGPDCEGQAEIVRWEPEKCLASREPHALIEWTLEARGAKTVVRVVQSGFSTGADWEDEWFESSQYGWGFMLLSLQWALDRHPGRKRMVAWPRQKTTLSRAETYRRVLRPGALFAGDVPGALETGQGYTLATATGETYTGTVEFSSDLRGFCLSVRELNDALFWLTIEGSPGNVELQIWLSAFDLPPTAVDAFEAAWCERLRQIAG